MELIVVLTDAEPAAMSRKTTRQMVPLKQAAGDLVDEDYGILCPTSGDDQPAGLRVVVLVLALLHILLALASISLGVAAICTDVTGYYIGYGVWCGLIVSACASVVVIGSILRGHSGPLCHALSLSLSWTSMRRRRATVAACDSSDIW